MSRAALALVEGQEYTAFEIRFGNPSSGCGDCDKPACFVLNEFQIHHDGVAVGTSMDYSNWCTWQGGSYDCPFIVPAVTSSWGRIKRSYR